MRSRLAALFTRSQLGAGLVVEIYGKPGCHLCEEVKEKLEALQRRWPFELREVNIAESAELLAEFGERIPLVWVEGKLACKYRVDEEALRRKLEQAALKHQARRCKPTKVGYGASNE